MALHSTLAGSNNASTCSITRESGAENAMSSLFQGIEEHTKVLLEEIEKTKHAAVAVSVNSDEQCRQLEADNQQLERKLQECRNKLTVAEGNERHLRLELNETREGLSKSMAENHSLVKSLENANICIEELTEEAASAKAEKDRIEGLWQDVQSLQEETAEALAKAESTRRTSLKIASEAEERETVLEKECERLRSERNSYRSSLEETTAELASVKVALQRAQEEVAKRDSLPYEPPPSMELLKAEYIRFNIDLSKAVKCVEGDKNKSLKLCHNHFKQLLSDVGGSKDGDGKWTVPEGSLDNLSFNQRRSLRSLLIQTIVAFDTVQYEAESFQTALDSTAQEIKNNAAFLSLLASKISLKFGERSRSFKLASKRPSSAPASNIDRSGTNNSTDHSESNGTLNTSKTLSSTPTAKSPTPAATTAKSTPSTTSKSPAAARPMRERSKSPGPPSAPGRGGSKTPRGTDKKSLSNRPVFK